jgi:putative effector of murein hydrolase
LPEEQSIYVSEPYAIRRNRWFGGLYGLLSIAVLASALRGDVFLKFILNIFELRHVAAANAQSRVYQT